MTSPDTQPFLPNPEVEGVAAMCRMADRILDGEERWDPKKKKSEIYDEQGRAPTIDEGWMYDPATELLQPKDDPSEPDVWATDKIDKIAKSRDGHQFIARIERTFKKSVQHEDGTVTREPAGTITFYQHDSISHGDTTRISRVTVWMENNPSVETFTRTEDLLKAKSVNYADPNHAALAADAIDYWHNVDHWYKHGKKLEPDQPADRLEVGDMKAMLVSFKKTFEVEDPGEKDETADTTSTPERRKPKEGGRMRRLIGKSILKSDAI